MNAPVPRRKFLSGVMLLGGAAATIPAFALPTPFTILRRKEVMLEQLTISDFTPRLGDSFELEAGGGRTVPVKLVEVTALGSSGPRPAHLASRAPFSLVFVAPRTSGIQQSIYRIQHEEMGEFDLFLVPIGLDEQGLRCEAIFN